MQKRNGRVRLSARDVFNIGCNPFHPPIPFSLFRSSLSQADLVARNTAHTATSPVAMKNYLPFVEKERHQSLRMMKRNEDHRPSVLCFASRRVSIPAETFEFSSLFSPLSSARFKLSKWLVHSLLKRIVHSIVTLTLNTVRCLNNCSIVKSLLTTICIIRM